MSEGIYDQTLTLTIPANIAGVAQTATLVPALGDVILYEVRFLFPTGCHGNVGIQVLNSNVPIIPFNNTGAQNTFPGGYVVGDGLTEPYEWGQESASALKVIGFNQGQFVHTVTLTFSYTPVAATALVPNASAIIPIS